MKKVLSLVLALVLVLGMIPTFAADMTGAEHLQAHNFIVGDENGNLMVEKVLTRDEMTVLFAQMYGKEVEAAAFVAPANFTDANTFGWAANFISFAQASEWIVGYPDGTYQPKNVVTGKELLSALMQVLGYDFEWNTIVADAAAVGLTVSTEGPILRGAAFETMWIAVSAIEINGEGMTIGEKTGKIAPPAPVVVDPKVDSVTFDNLKAFTVMFNQEVDEDTIKTTTVKATRGTTTLTAERVLLEDGKTLVVYLTNPVKLNQSDAVKVLIEGVKNLDGVAFEKFEATYTVNDVKVPQVLGAIALNPKQIELTFSEPVQFNYELFTLLNDIKVDDAAIIAKVAANYVDNTVLLTLSAALTEGTHTIEVKGVQDFAGFTAPTTTLTFTVVKDDTAPVAVSAVVKSRTSVDVTFDEPVEVTGEFKVNGYDATGVWINARTIRLNAGFTLDIGAIVEVRVEYRNQEDIMGNKVTAWKTILTSVTDDTTIPTVQLTSVAAVTNKITLTFSKSMAAEGKIELIDKDDELVATVNVTSFKANSDSKVLEVSFDELKGINAADYTLEITGMKDSTIRANALGTTTLAFKANDTKAPTVAAEYVVTEGDEVDEDTITIFFSEAMDVATIESLSNYYMNNKPFTAYDEAISAKAASDAKSVVITFEDARTLVTSPITVFAVKDVAGNVVNSSFNIAEYGEEVALTVTKVEATDVNTIKVTFNSTIKTAQPAAFVLINASTKAAVTNFTSATIGADSTVVTFKTATAINTSAGIYNVKVNSTASLKNIYNESLVANAEYSVIDLVRPTLKSVATTKVDNAVVANKITFTFSESIGNTDLDDFLAALLVKGSNGAVITAAKTGASVQIVNDKATVTFVGANLADADGNKTITVSFPIGAGIVDNNGNNILPVADQSVVIKVDVE